MKKIFIATFLAALTAGVAGCGFGRPALVVEMNGRKLEFAQFQAARIPRGLEITHFDPHNLHLVGDIPIEVNGLSISARGDDVNIGGRKFKVDREAQVRIGKDGEVEVRLTTEPVPSPSPPPAPVVPPSFKDGTTWPNSSNP